MLWYCLAPQFWHPFCYPLSVAWSSLRGLTHYWHTPCYPLSVAEGLSRLSPWHTPCYPLSDAEGLSRLSLGIPLATRYRLLRVKSAIPLAVPLATRYRLILGILEGLRIFNNPLFSELSLLVLDIFGND